MLFFNEFSQVVDMLISLLFQLYKRAVNHTGWGFNVLFQLPFALKNLVN